MYKAINMLLNYCFVVRFVRREKNMFSSNQILEVSGDLSHSNDLYIALEFALKFSGNIDSFIRTDNPSKCIYQITEDGRYCIGWAYEGIKDGWTEFQFDFTPSHIGRVYFLCPKLRREVISLWKAKQEQSERWREPPEM